VDTDREKDPENGNQAIVCRGCAGLEPADPKGEVDVCIAGNPATDGVCGDPDCVCAPDLEPEPNYESRPLHSEGCGKCQDTNGEHSYPCSCECHIEDDMERDRR
jgi:hypothetical protein